MLYVGPRRSGRPGPHGPWPPFVFSRGCLSRGSGGGQPKSLGSGFTSAPHSQGGEAFEGTVGARSPGGIGGKWTNAPGRCRGNHTISNKPLISWKWTWFISLQSGVEDNSALSPAEKRAKDAERRAAWRKARLKSLENVSSKSTFKIS